jgi:hypothetical protein
MWNDNVQLGTATNALKNNLTNPQIEPLKPALEWT